MRILWSASERRAAKPLPRALSAGAIAGAVARAEAVDAVALLGCTGPLTVEASADGWQTLAYTQDVDAAVDTLLTLSAAVPAASWRLRARGAATVGAIYPGRLATVRPPAYPYAVEPRVTAVDRRGDGGLVVSEVKAVSAAGTLILSGVREDEVASAWRPWWTDTAGGRRPWVLEDPLTSALHLVRATDGREFPLVRGRGMRWGGSMAVEALA
jgi:hypothetical protein